MVVGRFAPSPSGRLHLVNLFCCLLAWLSARQQGGRVVLRIEDLDTARCPRRYAMQAMEDLRWLGLTWDEGPGAGGADGPYFQSERTALYRAALQKLEDMGLVYPCFCTRAELHAASAPHRGWTGHLPGHLPAAYGKAGGGAGQDPRSGPAAAGAG